VPLDDIRKKIDQLDQQLLDLLSDRADLVHEVGEIKKKEGLQIYAPEREDALLKRLAKMNSGRLPDRSIIAIYREIMSAALALEDNLTVAYLGPEGTWTHQAAIKKFGHSIAYSSQPNFAEVFDQVARRKAHYGVVPIENSHILSISLSIRTCKSVLRFYSASIIAYYLPSIEKKLRHYIRTLRFLASVVIGSFATFLTLT